MAALLLSSFKEEKRATLAHLFLIKKKNTILLYLS